MANYHNLAARRLGIRSFECRYFEGDGFAAFVEAVRRNVQNGLALSLGD
jgi:hypothetical protein